MYGTCVTLAVSTFDDDPDELTQINEIVCNDDDEIPVVTLGAM